MTSSIEIKQKKIIEKIRSKLYGPEYLAEDLRNILKELDILLEVQDAIVLINNGQIKKQEFHGKGKDFLKSNLKIIRRCFLKVFREGEDLFLRNVSPNIKNLLVLAVKEKQKVIGALVIFNKNIEAEKDFKEDNLVKILKRQIAFSVKKAMDRANLLKVFGRYMDKRQIFEILKNPEFLKKPKVIESVVLFMDISGFTKLSNNSDPKFIFELLGNLLNKCSQIINKNSGIVDKFVGDQVIGIFGISKDEDMAENALKSAIEIRDVFKEFQKYGIGGKISVVKGSMIYGNLGGENKMDLTVIGKNVNFASRLCDYSKSGEILVGDKIYGLLKEKYKFKLKSLKKFKGFSEWSKVYRLV
jgi:class 3 adenylate cyclase